MERILFSSFASFLPKLSHRPFMLKDDVMSFTARASCRRPLTVILCCWVDQPIIQFSHALITNMTIRWYFVCPLILVLLSSLFSTPLC